MLLFQSILVLICWAKLEKQLYRQLGNIHWNEDIGIINIQGRVGNIQGRYDRVVNIQGRYYTVGDIHGRYDRVEFYPEVDYCM